MEAIDYLELKASGHAELQFAGPGKFQIKYKRFCPKKGTPLAAGFDNLNKEGVAAMTKDVEKIIAEKQVELAALKAIAADMEALEPTEVKLA